MKKALFALFGLFVLAASALNAWPQSVGDGPTGGVTNFPLCSRAWKQTIDREPFPSGENHAGWSFFYNTKKRCWAFQPATITTGQGALDSSVSLSQSAWTPLDTAVDAMGFRGGLAQYVPNGTYHMHGKISFSTGTANSQYEVAVTQGLSIQTAGAQKNIAIGTDPVGTGNHIVIGGGYCTSSGTANNPFQCTFNVPKFQCPVKRGQACEIRVWAYTSDPPASSPTALASSPHLAATNISSLILVRDRGLENEQ